MHAFNVIQHPLNRFSFFGNVGDLNPTERAALDQLMTLINDMQFRRESAWGTWARYFLLIDLSWFPQLCFSSQINHKKLRNHLWLYERGELENAFDVVPSAKTRGQSTATLNSAFKTPYEFPSGYGKRNPKLSLITTPSFGSSAPQSTAPIDASEKRRKG
jgi:hypothetical protein